MVPFINPFLLFSALSALSAALPHESSPSVSTPGQARLAPESKKTAPRRLQGRFLHITDFHPDPFYKPGSKTDETHICHHGSGDAGVLGAEATSCDSPLALVDATFDWIKHNLKDKVDFVVWTGDSARHDNDEEIPRTKKQVVGLNKMLVNKFVKVFGKDDNPDDPTSPNAFVVPIIPTIGNNDMLPHNIFERGPNEWTRIYLDMWSKFIPEEQLHSFAKGGWFYTEVIPNKLAVFSLNTMYFYAKNAAVDGCDLKSEPGYEQMEWLRNQLQFLRDRGVKAIITGHVPPARTAKKRGWDESCWQKYTLWMNQFRDVVVGAMYGHMDLDHFFYQDSHDLKYDWLELGEASEAEDLQTSHETFSIESKTNYLGELRDLWSSLPTPPPGTSYSTLDEPDDVEDQTKRDKDSKKQRKKQFLKEIGGKHGERFSLTLVSPSIIPTFFPTLRVIEYNITGVENASLHTDLLVRGNRGFSLSLPEQQIEPPLPGHDSSADPLAEFVDQELLDELKKEKKHKKPPPQPPFKVPNPPSKSAPPGPAYSPQTFTFLSYKQYFANLTLMNAEFKESGLSAEDYFGLLPDKKKKPKKPKKPKTPHLKNFKYEVEYDTKKDGIYKLKDLTVKSYLNLAQKIGQEAAAAAATAATAEKQKGSVKHNVWYTFLQRAFVMTKDEKEIDKKFS